MTTDLIKTLEELQSIRGYWFPEHSKAYVDSLPDIISALKDAERIRIAGENMMCVDPSLLVNSLGSAYAIKHYCEMKQALTPTADTKEETK